MSRENQVLWITATVLILITASAIYQSEHQTREIKDENGILEKNIWTDKETYILGDKVQAAIVFNNPADQAVELAPIYVFSFSGNSVHDPQKVTQRVNRDYADPRITVPAHGKLVFINSTFTPTYPGEFVITGLGLTKRVNVTGYKEVSLNSSGIRLVLEPSISKPEDRDYVDFSLVIWNDNAYPVKIPVFSPIYMGEGPDDLAPSTYISWISSHFTIESGASWRLNLRGYQVRYPGFSLYVSVDGVMAFIELEVSQ